MLLFILNIDVVLKPAGKKAFPAECSPGGDKPSSGLVRDGSRAGLGTTLRTSARTVPRDFSGQTQDVQARTEGGGRGF